MPNDQVLYMRRALKEHLARAVEVLQQLGDSRADIEMELYVDLQKFLLIQLFLVPSLGGINLYSAEGGPSRDIA